MCRATGDGSRSLDEGSSGAPLHSSSRPHRRGHGGHRLLLRRPQGGPSRHSGCPGPAQGRGRWPGRAPGGGAMGRDVPGIAASRPAGVCRQSDQCRRHRAVGRRSQGGWASSLPLPGRLSRGDGACLCQRGLLQRGQELRRPGSGNARLPGHGLPGGQDEGGAASGRTGCR